MKFGLRGHDLGKNSPEDLAQKLRAAGANAVQLAIPKAIAGVESYHDVTDSLLHRISAALEGIEISVLGCYIEPASRDAGDRARQMAVFEKGAYCAAALGANCIATETTRFAEDESERPAAFDILCGSLEIMLSYTSRENVRCAVEPVARHTLNTPELTRKLLNRFPLSIIFDPVNLLQPHTVDTQNALWCECFAQFGHEIIAVHMKNAALTDGALKSAPLEDGVMDYTTVIAPWLIQNKPGIALLREEARHETAARDLTLIMNQYGH